MESKREDEDGKVEWRQEEEEEQEEAGMMRLTRGTG
jgi:hypothetical protein